MLRMCGQEMRNTFEPMSCSAVRVCRQSGSSIQYRWKPAGIILLGLLNWR